MIYLPPSKPIKAWFVGRSITSRSIVRCAVVRGAVISCAMALTPLAAQAKPTAPALFCANYSASQTCATAIDCSQCHSTAPELNSYGLDVKAALYQDMNYTGETFDASLPAALLATQAIDSDGDGQSNADEIAQGTRAYDAQSFSGGSQEPAVWDANYALERVRILFCGASARYEHKLALQAAEDPKAYVHQVLSECLNSDYWQDEALHRIGDSRIRPIFEIGVDGALGIGNYEWDYRLFSYVLSDDRDARDLLLADYHVDDNGNVVTGIIERERPLQNPATGALNLGSGQPLIPERRVGMISTQWFLTYFTMFAELPRNAASQAYRAYLGLDIAKGEGLMPVAGEPRDVDNKGVAVPECAICHSTLDPLAYSFSTYAGIEETPGNTLFNSNPYGTYYPGRAPWEADGVLFNEPVADLLAWAEQAANTDAFKQNLTAMFMNYALGEGAKEKHTQTYNQLWPTVVDDNYSANQLIHRLVDSIAFGGKQ